MSRGLLHVKGCAGLGNRLITAAAAIEYATKNGRRVYIDWSDGQFAQKGVNAFENYFCLNKSCLWATREEVLDSNLTCYPSKIWQNEYSIDEFAIPVSLLKHAFVRNRITGSAARWSSAWKQKSEKRGQLFAPFLKSYLEFGEHLKNGINKDLVFFASYRPEIDLNKIVTHLSLRTKISKKVGAFVIENELEEKAIGVHIRHTDKQPLRNFEEIKSKIASLLIECDRVFVCTDNHEIEVAITSWFPNVVIQEKFYPENFEGGLHQYSIQTGDYSHLDQSFLESIIDMWSLSKCKYLLYQGNSSFSLISNALRNETLESRNWLDL